MNDIDLLARIAALVGQASIISVPTVAVVEAIRKRIAFDGWVVLIVAAGVCLVLSALLLSPASWLAARDAGAVALLAWAMAVGGDSWVSKVARKGKAINIIAPEARAK
jgi:hypothetical protein